jgi:iron complex outermembrane recepter protein
VPYVARSREFNLHVQEVGMIRSATPFLLLVSFGIMALPAQGLAQTPTPNLSQASLEDLMNIEITSASRKEQRATDVAAAVFVITHEDILRSGMTSVPDLLRLAPGVEVAQINSNKWAVSVRGFNGLYANKLLVLVDGRSLYNRLFSGVLWDFEDVVLDDIDRIEVIRGPGAAIWGANAVNGVINIITTPAAGTQGGLARVDAGGFGEQGVVRYGGTTGEAQYRLFAQWTGRDQSLIAPGTRADDASHSVTAGFRADWTRPSGAFTLEGNFTGGQARALWPNLNPQTAAIDPIANAPSDSDGGYLVGRWTQTRPSGASLEIQSVVDIVSRDEPVGAYRRHAFEFDTQYHAAPTAHHDFVAGADYQYLNERFDGGVGFSLTPSDDNTSLVSAFVQDEISLFSDRLAVTLGSQVQYETSAGAGVQPTARAMWKGLPRQRFWVAVSRALRTPSLYERGIRLDYPPVPTATGLPLFVTAVGNSAAQTETLVDSEVGYRLEIGTAASIDVTGFVSRYNHLSTQDMSAPDIELVPSPRILVTSQFVNTQQATTTGLEASGHWAPLAAWRVDASYTGFHSSLLPSAPGQATVAATTDPSAPETQWQVRSTFLLNPRATLAVAFFHVGALEQLGVDAYTRADVNAEWRFSNRLSVMAIGQNLLSAGHAEFGGTSSLLMATEVPRSANLRLRWTF